jgi:hypothetical protein
MTHTVTDPKSLQPHLDAAMVSICRLRALAGLLAVEEVASAFAGLSAAEQVAIFGAFEACLDQASSELVSAADIAH